MGRMRTTGLPDIADIVIVGGGMAGLQLAVDLAGAQVGDVLLLEAGPDSGGHVNAAHDPDLALRMWLEVGLDPHHWRPWLSASAPHFETMAGLRRRLGGRSLYWHGVVLPMDSWALTEPSWPAEIIDDLTVSWAGGESLYQRVLTDLDDWRGGIQERGPELRVGSYRLSTVPQAVRKLPSGRFAAYSPIDRSAETSGRVRLVTGAEVLDVQTANGSVCGVRVVVDGESTARAVRCGTVVLAGGTIESSRLAIQALQPAGLLDKGRLDGLSDKIVHGFIAPLDAATLPPEVVRLADEEAFLYASGDETLRSNLFVRLYRNTVGSVLVDVWAMGEQLAGEHGTVECRPGAGLRWETTVRAECSAADRESIGRQRDELTAVWSAFAKESGLAGSALKFPEFDRPERTLENVLPRAGALSPGEAPVTWSGPLGSEYHESGTLAFGRMLNERHEVHGMRNLYVAGPAAYPRPGAANPSLTNLALSKRLSGVLSR